VDRQALAEEEWWRDVRNWWWRAARNTFVIIVVAVVLLWVLEVKGQAQTMVPDKSKVAILPPVEFDRPYAGTLTIMRGDRELVQKECAGKSRTACAIRGHSSLVPPRCRIVIVDDDTLATLPWPWSDFYVNLRHEVGHCNGWPQEHPNARPVEPQQATAAPRPQEGTPMRKAIAVLAAGLLSACGQPYSIEGDEPDIAWDCGGTLLGYASKDSGFESGSGAENDEDVTLWVSPLLRPPHRRFAEKWAPKRRIGPKKAPEAAE
jgi:hypothetical protein